MIYIYKNRLDYGNKYSKWISTENYYMANTGTYFITTCSKVIYDSGGPNGNYHDNASSILTIYPDEIERLVSLKGTIYIECCNYDHLYIYNGGGTNGILLASYHDGRSNIPLIVSTTGPLTIKFTSDRSITRSGFELFISCKIGRTQKTNFNLSQNNNCHATSCDNNWKNIQKLLYLAE